MYFRRRWRGERARARRLFEVRQTFCLHLFQGDESKGTRQRRLGAKQGRKRQCEREAGNYRNTHH
jgi:hypothetical protein